MTYFKDNMGAAHYVRQRRITGGAQAMILSMEKDATLYVLTVVEAGDKEFIEEMGGRFIVSLLSPTPRSAYVFNEGYKHPSYVAEKFPGLTYEEAENVAGMLNKFFGGGEE